MSKENLKNKGITLIALIITIIVMLILTGVTLSVTLGDNGLVNKASTASDEMQKEIDKELLLSAVLGAIDENGNFNVANLKLPAGFTGKNGTYISENGYSFKVDTNGTVTSMGEIENTSSADLEPLKAYFLGEIDETTGERPGNKGSQLLQNTEIMEEYIGDYLSDIKFKNNQIISDAENIEVIHYSYSETDDEELYLLYFLYNSNTYILFVKETAESSYDEEDWLFMDVELLETTNIDLNGTYRMFTNSEGFLSIEGNKFNILDEWEDEYELNVLKAMKTNNNNNIHLFMKTNDGYEGVIYLNYKDIYNNNEKVNRIIYIPPMMSVFYQNLNGLSFDLEGNYVCSTGNNGKSRLRFEKDSSYVYYEMPIYGTDGWETREQVGYFKNDGQYTMIGAYDVLGTGKGHTEIQVSEDLDEITMDGNVYVLEEESL